MNERSQNLLKIVPIACLAGSILVLTLYLFKYAVVDFTSDAAMNSMLAREMREKFSVFPVGWSIADGESTFPSSAMLIAPLLSFMPNGFHAHMVVSWLLALIFVFAFYESAKSVGINSYLALAGTAALALGFSNPFIRMTYVETAYFWAPFCMMACLILMVKSSRNEDSRYFFGIFFIVFLFSLKNPQRNAAMVVVPLTVFSLFLHLDRIDFSVNFIKDSARRLAPLYFGFLLAAAVDFLLKKFQWIDNHASATNMSLGTWGNITENFSTFFNGWFQYMGSQAEFNGMTRFEPAFNVIRSAFILGLTIFGGVGTFHFIRSENGVGRALAASFYVSFFIIFVLYVFSANLAVGNYGTMRYFTVPYLLLFLMALLYIAKLGHEKYILIIASSISLLMLLAGVNRLIPCLDNCSPRRSQDMDIARMLQQEGLHFGYAGWWIAGSPSILSEEDVFVAPVQIFEHGLIPMPMRASRDWYAEGRQNREKFLMLQPNEATPEVLAMLRRKTGGWIREFRAVNVLVLVFDKNARLF